MANLYDWLDAGNTLVGDGAMGTALQNLGLTDGGAPELWNVEHPDRVASVLDGYAAAGANALIKSKKTRRDNSVIRLIVLVQSVSNIGSS